MVFAVPWYEANKMLLPCGPEFIANTVQSPAERFVTWIHFSSAGYVPNDFNALHQLQTPIGNAHFE